MKRSVLISIFCLWGLQSPGNLSPGYTYLTSIAPCDALCINPKGISNVKLSCFDKFKLKDQYALSPLQSKHQKLPVASINTSVVLLTEAQTGSLSSRSLSHSRRKTNKYKTFLLNCFNNDIKVPP
ncbi:MAG: hypothetical protein ACXVAU_00585 [Mucilaginibacter sp.]